MERDRNKPSAAPSNLTAIIVMVCLLLAGAAALLLATRSCKRLVRTFRGAPRTVKERRAPAKRKARTGLGGQFKEALDQAMRMKELQRKRMEEIQRRIEEVERGGGPEAIPAEPLEAEKRVAELERALEESEAARRAAERRLRGLEKAPTPGKAGGRPPAPEGPGGARVVTAETPEVEGAPSGPAGEGKEEHGEKERRPREEKAQSGREAELRASYEKVKNEATVYLKNRGLFRGEIFRETPGELLMRVSTDDAGDIIEIRISKGEIRRIERLPYEKWRTRQGAP